MGVAVRVAVISPHLDDAVFSCAERMLARPNDEFTIICPYAEAPKAEPHRSKYETLRAEHSAVCRFAGWGEINGPFYDDAINDDQSKVSMEAWLDHWLRYGEYDEVWSPYGIHHPDHHRVAGAMAFVQCGALLYEELPYYVDYPDQRPSMEFAEFVPYTRTLKIEKMRLCATYESQVDEDVLRRLSAPEMLWRLS